MFSPAQPLKLIFFLPILVILELHGTRAQEQDQSQAGISSHIQEVTACWILTVRDHTKHNKTLEQLLDAQSFHENQLKSKNKTELFYRLQVNMVKKCFQLIASDDVAKVLDSMQNPNITHRHFRQIVPNFDYGTYLQQQKYGSEIKNDKIDELFLTMILELEKQLGFFPAREMRDAADSNTYLFGITSKNFAFFSFLALFFFAIATFILCIHISISYPSGKKAGFSLNHKTPPTKQA